MGYSNILFKNRRYPVLSIQCVASASWDGVLICTNCSSHGILNIAMQAPKVAPRRLQIAPQWAMEKEWASPPLVQGRVEVDFDPSLLLFLGSCRWFYCLRPCFIETVAHCTLSGRSVLPVKRHIYIHRVFDHTPTYGRLCFVSLRTKIGFRLILVLKEPELYRGPRLMK